ncbi:MAG: glycerophosphodiester phosphodiesterase [Clostridiales bacterium]|nr:glycerophosphodiester phosphodiesterase [Clostridiales bacterium]
MMIILIFVTILAIAYLFLIAPRMTDKPDAAALMGVYYAHRGLHDNKSDAPENSMAAIRKAVEQGYGIEFDVQLTRDRIPVVFHDESLRRVCGTEGNVRDYTYEELQQFPLLHSQERIPLLSDVLAAVDGKVPLIIEIKIHEQAAEVCARAEELISAYKGPYCIESFDPRAVAWYKKNRPQVIRGQLSANFNKPERHEPFMEMLVHYLLTNVIARPDFIAYDHHHKKNASRVLCRKLFGALSVAWTLKSQQELDAAKDDFDLFIFEQFIPGE